MVAMAFPVWATRRMATETQPRVNDEPVLYGAIVHVAVAPMHCEPRVASAMISQQLAGHRLDVVEADGEWVRARGVDRYDGWVHQGFLSPLPPTGARQSLQTPRVSLGCVTRDVSGSRRVLPLRAYLGPDETVDSGEVVPHVELPQRFPLEPRAIVHSALKFFNGTSYLWGGVTPWGADCSGLAQSVFSLHGIQLPRDAWMQSEAGEPAGNDMDSLRPADLLFFSDRADGRVTHVGIALGNGRMVHLALGRGGYAVDVLRDVRDPYVAKLRERFVCARRVV